MKYLILLVLVVSLTGCFESDEENVQIGEEKACANGLICTGEPSVLECCKGQCFFGS